jgi:ATP-dependent DNA helicase RecG
MADAPRRLSGPSCGFCQYRRGQLIFGAANSCFIARVENSDRATRDVDNVAVNNCEPPITVIQEVLYPSASPHGRPVVVVNIPKGDMRPYRTNRGVYYIRPTFGRHQASREELLRLFQATESLYYDETSPPRLTLTDLDLDPLDRYLEATGQEELKSNRERLLFN